MKTSIFTTLYNSSKYIREFYKESIELTKFHSNVIVVELSKNFGYHKAIMTELKNTTGDYEFFIDSDLKERPSLLFDFYQTLIKKY